jgi:hypothetical protein
MKTPNTHLGVLIRIGDTEVGYNLATKQALKGVSKRRAEMLEILQKDDQISQLYCTE